ncbi:MAG: FMN-binding protein, partial [Bacillota bacterium]|nr:FMN-binding protein [Bacillota bacterium]
GNKLKDVKIVSHKETAGIADPAINDLPKEMVKAQSADVDSISGATITSDAIKEAVKDALAKAGVSLGAAAAWKNVPVTYKAGTYEGKGAGMNGPVVLDVTFSENAITDIKVKSSRETEYVGTPAFDILFKDAMEANGSGVDVVSGATFTCVAVKNALNDAASKAGASDLAAFKKNKVTHE